MRYLLLIYDEEPIQASPSSRRRVRRVQRVHRGRSRDRGLFEAGEALEPTSSATTVRVRDGETVDDRRSVRRDEGVPRRLLPLELPRSRRGDRARGAGSRPRSTARSRSARSGSTARARATRSSRRRRRLSRRRPAATRHRRSGLMPPATRTPSSTASSARSRAGRSQR